MNRMILPKNFPWYALLIAVYSPLTLLAENVGEVGFFAADRAIIVVFLGELLLLMILKKIYGDWQKTGFVASLLTVLMFSYGHVYSLLEGAQFAGVVIGRHRYLLVVWILLIALVLFLVGRLKRFSVFEDAVRTVSIVLVAFVVIRLSAFYYLEWQAMQAQVPGASSSLAVSSGKSPDVYYIILDAYGRSDVLLENFDVDNTDFLNSLRSLGFYIADCSQSNYAHTRLSLVSSLNYNYLTELGNDFVPGSRDWADLTGLIRNNAVRRFLEGENYQVIAFETGYAWTEWRDADLFLEHKESFLSKNLTSFETLFLYTTMGAVAVDFGWLPEPQKNVQHYERILSNLDALAGLAGGESPKFVFAHLVIPHHPFVFDANGGYVHDPSLSPAFENYTDEEYYNGYRQQVMFINNRILKTVESILSNSVTPPIIIIQGDHGPSHVSNEAHVAILNAYYFPDGFVDQLSQDITPVNTFRVILDTYFGQNLPMLPDIAYFSRNADPYTYTVIPNECKP